MGGYFSHLLRGYESVIIEAQREMGRGPWNFFCFYIRLKMQLSQNKNIFFLVGGWGSAGQNGFNFTGIFWVTVSICVNVKSHPENINLNHQCCFNGHGFDNSLQCDGRKVGL